jgi:proline dehydrogenase
MPGENIDQGIVAAQQLQTEGIGSILTFLGENVAHRAEAVEVREEYLRALLQIRAAGLTSTISVKLTQLGLDLEKEFCYFNLQTIIEASSSNIIWIDMESSGYVDATLELYRRASKAYRNVGVCLQAYLRRTAADLASLLPFGPAVRLVKGAYSEPAEKAYPKKADVDENFFYLSKQLLGEKSLKSGTRTAIATHDIDLIRRTQDFVTARGLSKSVLEYQMLYGIQVAEQERLSKQGWSPTVLVSYGSYWFPWFMRRLAERPANLLFLMRNLWSR